MPKLRELLDRILSEAVPFDDYPLEHRFSNIGFKQLRLRARLLKEEATAGKKILLAMEEIKDGEP
ncbi:MAG: hypothetical protein U5R49_27475 [Deltaproteobacteria bacterium]|nr:hypothetical protein [Deltaproteobacteria bacterium]